jgi:hypothetical protein
VFEKDCEINDPALTETAELTAKHRPLTVLTMLKDRFKGLSIDESLQELRNPHTNQPVFTLTLALKGSAVVGVSTNAKKKSCKTLAAQDFLQNLFAPLKWLQMLQLLEPANKRLLETLVMGKLQGEPMLTEEP